MSCHVMSFESTHSPVEVNLDEWQGVRDRLVLSLEVVPGDLHETAVSVELRGAEVIEHRVVNLVAEFLKRREQGDVRRSYGFPKP